MEDTPLGRKVEFICNRGDDSGDGKGAIMAGTEFDRRVLREVKVFSLKPDLIADSILICKVMSVCLEG